MPPVLVPPHAPLKHFLKHRLWAWLVFFLLFFSWLALLKTTLVMGDSQELAAAIAEPGIAHPPGYAAYTMLGHLWGRLLRLVAGETLMPWSLATNLFSLVWAAVAVFFWLACCRGLAGAVRRRRAANQLLFCALLLIWSAHPMMMYLSASTEVYAMHIGLISLTWWLTWRLAFSARRRRGAPALGLVLSLSLAGAIGCLHHATFVLMAPPVLMVTGVSLWRWRKRIRPAEWAKGAATAVAGIVCGALTLLYLPLRSQQHPQCNWGKPGDSLVDFWNHITARQYRLYMRPTGESTWQLTWQHMTGIDRLYLCMAACAVIWGVARMPRRNDARQSASGRLDERRLIIWGLFLFCLLQLSFNAFYHIPDISAYFLPVWWGVTLGAAAGFGRFKKAPQRASLWLTAFAGAALAGAAIWNGVQAGLTRSRMMLEQRKTERIISVWRGLPQGPARVLITGDQYGLLNYEQVAEKSRLDLTIISLAELVMPKNFFREAGGLGMAPILFYEDGNLPPMGAFANNIILAGILKRNIWARMPGKLMDIDPGLIVGGTPDIRDTPVEKDFAFEMLPGSDLQRGDMAPIHKYLKNFEKTRNRLPVNWQPALWDAPLYEAKPPAFLVQDGKH